MDPADHHFVLTVSDDFEPAQTVLDTTMCADRGIAIFDVLVAMASTPGSKRYFDACEIVLLCNGEPLRRFYQQQISDRYPLGTTVVVTFPNGQSYRGTVEPARPGEFAIEVPVWVDASTVAAWPLSEILSIEPPDEHRPVL